MDSLGIESYGISVTTLEEVFLKVGHGDDTNDDMKAKNALKENNENPALKDKNNKEADQLMQQTSQEDDFSISDPQY